VKIWYLSRTYLPEKTGGALIRIAQVDFFRSQGAEVVVVAPDYSGHDRDVSESAVRLPYWKARIRLDQIFERLGLYEDYLDVAEGAGAQGGLRLCHQRRRTGLHQAGQPVERHDRLPVRRESA
jgi:hypothetical protein